MSVKKVANKKEFDAEIAGASGLVVVDFFATWCGPCRAISPKVESMAAEFTTVLFLKVDVDENSDTAEAEEISAMPTFKFYKNGAKVDELTGANEAKLRGLIEKHK
ncbi:thioredoxin-like [Antedon mediterranea]|uniref:thioredoxin-like n=1 Tax=Antedon mediterranea TaxID=105859 RepID=UPI003AF75ABE